MLSETTRFRYSEHVDGPLEFNRFCFLVGGGEEIVRHVSRTLKHTRMEVAQKPFFPVYALTR